VLRLRRYERISVRNRRFHFNGGWLTQNFRQKRSPPTNHSSSQKTSLNDHSYSTKKIWTDLSSVLSQCTRLTDRQTDRQTPFSSPMQHGNNLLVAKGRLCSAAVKVTLILAESLPLPSVSCELSAQTAGSSLLPTIVCSMRPTFYRKITLS